MNRRATTFFRLLRVPIDAKGDALAERIAARNATGAAEETYTLDPAAFAQIPGSPFAYWVSDSIRRLFNKLSPFEGGGRAVRVGLQTGDDFRFVRTWWEVAPNTIVCGTKGTTPADFRQLTLMGHPWVPFAKGGEYSQFYADIHLVVNWDRDGKGIRSFPKAVVRNEVFYFLCGLTWSDRTTRQFSARAWRTGGIFSVKGSAGFFPQNELRALGLMNSRMFNGFLSLLVGAGDAAARSYQVGTIGSVPFPAFGEFSQDLPGDALAALACEAQDLQRDRDRTDETTHAFCLPGLVAHRDAPTLRAASAALDAGEQARQARLAAIQAQIDDIVFDLYGLSEADRALVRRETGSPQLEAIEAGVEVEEEAEEEIAAPQDPIARVQDFLMWCVGVAFGRWDVRKALDRSLLPPLGGPFDPLPRYAPGALIDDPLGAQSAIPSDGILVDDPTHPSDIVRRVREVLDLLWGDRADAIETEACEILGVKSLRDYFRDPRRFFAYHIKRYSKSRRKAPIYWLLQSERRNYAIWLSYHRITPMTLYIAGRDYADSKIALESARLDDLRAGLEALNGSARRNREKEIERQEKLVAEVIAFGKTLDKIALANLPPDPNDGVLISIAPLHPLAPWPEAARMWEALRSGQYGWSTMGKKMAEGGRQ